MELLINHLNYVCIHNAYTLPEGFQGDALILDESHPRASALERSSRSFVSAIGLIGPGVINFELEVIHTHPLDFSPTEHRLADDERLGISDSLKSKT